MSTGRTIFYIIIFVGVLLNQFIAGSFNIKDLDMMYMGICQACYIMALFLINTSVFGT